MVKLHFSCPVSNISYMHLKFLLYICLAFVATFLGLTSCMTSLSNGSCKNHFSNLLHCLIPFHSIPFHSIPFRSVKRNSEFFRIFNCYQVCNLTKLFALLLRQTVQFYALRPFTFSRYLHRQKLIFYSFIDTTCIAFLVYFSYIYIYI